ncbi:DUF1642 domain-containing protein [Aerococcus urinaeequi]|uniref:DUF1642 domain-containing protein n=1 Tax=Aerococcus urinaeequi TaxID=51665 RepID=UPI0036703805
MKIEIDKPVVPQFVAEWIESNSSGFNIRGALEGIDSWTTPDILDWCRKVDGELSYKTLVTAYLYGYEVEKEPLCYAKIKGWELATSKSVFWNYRSIIESPMLPRLYTGDKEDKVFVKTKMTTEKWNKVGINDTNADFEEVE